jgi:hypothetical protein
MKGIIYKIICKTTGNIYIGSSFNTVEERIKSHEFDYCKFLGGVNKTLTSFIILKENNYSYEVIEKVRVENATELTKIEGKYIKKFKGEGLPIVNKIVAGRTRKEYYDDNAETIRENVKKYYKDNCEKIREKRKNNMIECECGCIIRSDGYHKHEKTKKHIKYIENKNPFLSDDES